MTKNLEHEVLGEVDLMMFESLLTKWSDLYGKPKLTKRLAISFWDPIINKNADTRIRITNGRAEIMQKTGEWEHKKSLKVRENSLPLKTVGDVITAYKILLNFTRKEFPPRIIQHESHIFETDEFEIKLAKQFGKSDRYIFEIEQLGDSDLHTFVSELSLTKYVLITDSDFWLQWNKDVNLSVTDVTGKELHELIALHMNS